MRWGDQMKWIFEPLGNCPIIMKYFQLETGKEIDKKHACKTAVWYLLLVLFMFSLLISNLNLFGCVTFGGLTHISRYIFGRCVYFS